MSNRASSKQLLVVIVTYNAMQWAKRCFDSLQRATVPNDVYVVDNGSTDGTQEYIQRVYPGVIFRQSTENLGFGRANNLGIEYALAHGYKYVYLLNQDAWVDPDAFEKLIEAAEQNPGYGIISPMQMAASRERLDPSFEYIHCNLVGVFKGETLHEVDFVMAAHWLIPTEHLSKVGGFSHAFAHYGEDVNLCDRMQFFGLKVGVCSLALAVHDREFRAKESPEKKALNYAIKYNTIVNNPAANSRFRDFVYLMDYILIIARECKKASFSSKYKAFKNMLKYFWVARSYRSLYKVGKYHK